MRDMWELILIGNSQLRSGAPTSSIGSVLLMSPGAVTWCCCHVTAKLPGGPSNCCCCPPLHPTVFQGQDLISRTHWTSGLPQEHAVIFGQSQSHSSDCASCTLASVLAQEAAGMCGHFQCWYTLLPGAQNRVPPLTPISNATGPHQSVAWHVCLRWFHR